MVKPDSLVEKINNYNLFFYDLDLIFEVIVL